MPVEGYICLVTVRYIGELKTDFFDCLEEDDGTRWLMIQLHDYPAFYTNVVHHHPTDPQAIRRVEHPDFQYVCDEVVDLDKWLELDGPG